MLEFAGSFLMVSIGILLLAFCVLMIKKSW